MAAPTRGCQIDHALQFVILRLFATFQFREIDIQFCEPFAAGEYVDGATSKRRDIVDRFQLVQIAQDTCDGVIRFAWTNGRQAFEPVRGCR